MWLWDPHPITQTLHSPSVQRQNEWVRPILFCGGHHCVKSTRLKYAVELWRYYLSDRLNYRYRIVAGGGWIASGSTGWKAMGSGDAKALVVICLLSGIDHIKGVVKFFLILQVFSSFRGRFSLVVTREGLDNSPLSGFFVRGIKHLSCLPSRGLSYLPVSCVQVHDKKAFSSYVVIMAGDLGQKVSWKEGVTVTCLILLFRLIYCFSPSMGLDGTITSVLQGLTSLRHQHYSHLSLEENVQPIKMIFHSSYCGCYNY